MSSPLWHSDRHVARFSLDRLCGSVDVARPERGVSDVRVGGHAIAEANLLGLNFPSRTGTEALVPVESYHRGRDLIAAYSESSSWPVRVDVVWHAVLPAESPGVLAAIDAIVSVRTSLWESWPELAVRSRLVPCEILRLADAMRLRFEPCTSGASGESLVGIANAPCCLVFRFPGAPFSYAEMAHPSDSRGVTLSGGPAAVEIRHGLFAERLEKGVILRARVRGAIVDRADDLASAGACYRAFSAADPPLGA